MNTTIHPSTTPEASVRAPTISHDYAEFASPGERIEHMTALEFLRSVPGRRWNLHEYNRFGALVQKTAESSGLAYVGAFMHKFGTIRTYPLALLEGIYGVLAGELGWPKLGEQPALEEGGAQRLRANRRASERARKSLQTVADEVSDPEVASAIAVVIGWLEKRAQGEDESATPPLRAL